MRFEEFHAGLRALLNIDADEFLRAAYGYVRTRSGQSVPPKWVAEWLRFRDDPHRWFICAPDAKARAIWKIVQERTAP